ncbi:sugar phosphate isomerase/epimerase [bacterium]|nr:MAG: sugar phosphate isomerase/epimerase [bacterium]
MKLAVSNIAWEPAEETAAARLLDKLGVNLIELAPTKRWPDLSAAPATEVSAYRHWWEERGFTVVATQSILFGRPEVQVFGDESVRRRSLDFLKTTIRLSADLGAKIIVFGSPKNRQKGPLTDQEAFDQAVPFFAELGSSAHEAGVQFCIEPNAPAYACDFVTTAAEGAALVKAVNTPGFALHLDAACMAMVSNDPVELTRYHHQHFHISAPMLESVPDAGVPYAAMATALHDSKYSGVYSIEMKAQGTSNIARVEQAVRFALETFGN